ncbi:hypothetical protein SH139x_003387 [Planctomycetaceae bacterium SH139]
MRSLTTIVFYLIICGFTVPTVKGQNAPSTIEGTPAIILNPTRPPKPAFLYSAIARATLRVDTAVITQNIELNMKVIQGQPRTVLFALNGPGEVVEVQGDSVESWSVRTKEQQRYLELTIRGKSPKDQANATDAQNDADEQNDTAKQARLNAAVVLRTELQSLPAELEIANLGPGDAVGFDSIVHIDFASGLTGKVLEAEGFAPLAADNGKLHYQTATGGRMLLQLQKQSTAPDPIELSNMKVIGQLHPNGKSIDFRLTGETVVTEPGARLRVLAGNAAVNSMPGDGDYRLELVETEAGEGVYELVFPASGQFPIDLQFVAAVTTTENNWQAIELTLAASAVMPIQLSGFATNVEFLRAAKTIVPTASEAGWNGFLPASGQVRLQWKDVSAAEGDRKLFFTTQARVEAQVGPGLLRQTHRVDYKVLQGELKSLQLQLLGPGEILDVEGNNLVGWQVVDDADNGQRLEITLGQPIVGEAQFRIRSQTTLDAFPVRVDGTRLQPIGAVRHSGYLRITNAGSVQVEPTGLQGLTQLAPEQFPGETTDARQTFVYRFPAAGHAFTMLADQVQPEVNVNALFVYQLSDSDRVITADVEFDIREAAIREWDLQVPADYSIVAVTGANLADYVAASETEDERRSLKVIFQQDVLGRQLISLRLEKSQAAAAGEWQLPRIDFPQANAVRGDIGVVGSPGYRMVLGATDLLTEKPLSYFPQPQTNLQQAFRIREPDWSATVQVEALERSIQADVFHLYSLSQGTIYGSALVNYFVTSSPTADLQLTVPAELENVTVDGQDVRTWRRDADTLNVNLHQPVMGTYTLLITFEQKPNEIDGSFAAGLVTPLNVQGDRGYIEIVSPMQVEVEPLLVSNQLLVLDPLELPAEFRLLSTAPTLGTWQYTERPFDLKLKVEWFQPGTTADQVVEYAEANSRVSPDGQLVTDVVYYVKSRGQRTLRLQLPPDPVRLWAVTVNGQPITARQTDTQTLIPLPGSDDPNVPVEVSLRLGKPAVDEHRAELLLPIVMAPVLKTQWNLQGDENHMLLHSGGTVAPTIPVLWPSGFDWLATRGLLPLVSFAGLVLIGIYCSSLSHQFLSMLCFTIAVVVAGAASWDAFDRLQPPAPLQLSLPVVAAGEVVALQVRNLPTWWAQLSWVGFGLVSGGLGVLVVELLVRANLAKRILRLLWMGLISTGILLHPNGGLAFFVLLAVVGFFLLFLPAMKTWLPTLHNWRETRSAQSPSDGSSNSTGSNTGGENMGGGGPAVVTNALLLFLVSNLLASTFAATVRADQASADGEAYRAADALTEQWQVTSREAKLTAQGTMQVTGAPGDRFVLLRSPATLTRFDGDGIRLSKIQDETEGLVYIVTIPAAAQASADLDSAEQLNPFEGLDDTVEDREEIPNDQVNSYGKTERSAIAPQSYTATFEYQLHAVSPTTGIPVLSGRAALHELSLKYDKPGWEVRCAAAVRVESVADEPSQTRAKLLLGPKAVRAEVVLQPQSRDLSSEETEFFVEGQHLYTLGPGVVDGSHHLQVRVAKGRVRELSIDIPAGLTVSAVDASVADAFDAWQFDADTRRLMLQLAGLSSSFVIQIETQRGLESLPADLTLSPPRVRDANSEVGLVAIAFSGDAQPEKVESSTFSMVSLRDFDATRLKDSSAVLQRVYRYGQNEGNIEVRVAPVSPEVRVASRQVLSIGDERIVLGVNFSVEIARTGLFQLSFPLPTGLEVESLSGEVLHHWLETSAGDQRQVVLHLNGKTLGTHTFALALAGVAPTDVSEWSVPRFEIKEADRQTGDLVVRPMRGMRIRATSRQNVSESDPRELGGQGEGALAFRLLQQEWNLVLGIEKLDAWVTGQVLHEVLLREGQTRSTLVADFNVENAAIRSLFVELPIANGDEIKTVRASGKSVADFVRTAADSNRWELQFKQRVMGRVQFQVEYERRGERANSAESLTVIAFPDARQLDYYYAIRAGGRLEIDPGTLTQGWQRTDWNTVPANLRESSNRSAPALSLRAVAPTTPLMLNVIRHSLADSLKLRVASGTLTTLLSPTGDQLTAVDVTMDVIQRSSLQVTLPAGGELFNIFVNGESVHSIRQNSDANAWQFYILPGIDDRTAQVRFVYLLTGDDLNALPLLSPQLNVPLENVQWDVVAPQGFRLIDNDGDLELIHQERRVKYDRQRYLTKVSDRQKSQAKQAEDLLAQATQMLQAGQQSKAQRALSNVANRNSLDAASNEDARVQLENLQTQQAVVGLNTRRQRLYLDHDLSEATAGAGQQMRQAAAMNPILQQAEVNYRPQEISQLLAGNTSEDNAILQQIAGRLVQHQRATGPPPQAIVFSLPEEGTVYSFSRGVQVAEDAPLKLNLRFRSQYSLQWWQWLMVCCLVATVVLGVAKSET